MKVLILSTPSKFRRTRLLWESLQREAGARLEVLGQGHYRDWAEAVEDPALTDYRWVIADVNLRRMGSGFGVLRGFKGLAILDFDVVQNFLPRSDYRGVYESLLKSLPPHRLVVTGAFVAEELKRKGFDAAYMPKAYDPRLVRNLRTTRDIEVGFIGRTKHRVYTDRRLLVQRLQRQVGLRLERTEEGADYNQMLNRMRIFVVPDLGFPELMIKNFEAMAAGCALVTARQSQAEMDALGLVDMENVALYGDESELVEKVACLQHNPELAQRLAEAGQQLAESRHTWQHRASTFWEHLGTPPQTPPPLTWTDRWRLMRLTLSPKRDRAVAS